MAGQPGPVAVLLSLAALTGEVGPQTRPRLYPTAHYLPPSGAGAEPDAIQHAAELLVGADRPIIVAGNGVRIAQGYAALQGLAERLGAPVVTTPSGKGVLAETHPLALGVFGTYGLPVANAAVTEADVVLVIGSRLTASDTARANPALLDPVRQTFLQVDIEPRNAAWTFPAECQLIGDAATIMEQLLAAFPEMPARDGTGRAAAHRRARGWFDEAAYHAAEAPLMPQRIIAGLHATLPEDTMVTCDTGENRIFMRRFLQVRRAGHFLQAAGAGPMGFAIPAALAAKLIHPERPAVAVCGDGGFAMTMNGLMTALEHELPIIVVVSNNSALGWSLHSGGPSPRSSKISTTPPSPRPWAAVAFGWSGRTSWSLPSARRWPLACRPSWMCAPRSPPPTWTSHRHLRGDEEQCQSGRR
ncbi:thiamine pyrophosphate-binding protein [Sediminicoccus sp. BL-A-41-H5]|uniref:thiamine pyrophosphate-binding protein n=1 Tax=Sediminicoccus sp. BL-A-41-H5 TaxID=3421106 RepID=UPI003D67E98C